MTKRAARPTEPGTSPTALTSWKARVLEELYVHTFRFFSAGTVQRGQERLNQIRDEVRVLCPERGGCLTGGRCGLPDTKETTVRGPRECDGVSQYRGL